MARTVATTRTVASRRSSAVKHSYSYRFNGSTYITLDTNNQFVSTSPFACSFWADFGAYALVSNAVLRNIWSFKTDLGGGYCVAMTGFTTGTAITAGPATPPTNFVKIQHTTTATGRDALRRGWHMITVTYDGVSPTTLSSYKLYIDGVSQTISTNATGNTINNNNSIGASGSSFPAGIGTLLTRCRAWSGGSAMTAAQVADLYYDDTLPSGPTLIREYLFTEGSGSTVADTSGGGFNGTITVAGTWSSDVPRLSRTVATTTRTVA